MYSSNWYYNCFEITISQLLIDFNSTHKLILCVNFFRITVVEFLSSYFSASNQEEVELLQEFRAHKSAGDHFDKDDSNDDDFDLGSTFCGYDDIADDDIHSNDLYLNFGIEEDDDLDVDVGLSDNYSDSDDQ